VACGRWRDRVRYREREQVIYPPTVVFARQVLAGTYDGGTKVAWPRGLSTYVLSLWYEAAAVGGAPTLQVTGYAAAIVDHLGVPIQVYMGQACGGSVTLAPVIGLPATSVAAFGYDFPITLPGGYDTLQLLALESGTPATPGTLTVWLSGGAP
jgi:hypothetical protein